MQYKMVVQTVYDRGGSGHETTGLRIFLRRLQPLKFVQRTMEQDCKDRVHDFQLVIEKGKKRKTIIVIRPNFLHPALRCECVLGAFDSR